MYTYVKKSSETEQRSDADKTGQEPSTSSKDSADTTLVKVCFLLDPRKDRKDEIASQRGGETAAKRGDCAEGSN